MSAHNPDLAWVHAAYLLADKLHDQLAKLIAAEMSDPAMFDGVCRRCNTDHSEDLRALMKAAHRDALVLAAFLNKDPSTVDYLIHLESPA